MLQGFFLQRGTFLPYVTDLRTSEEPFYPVLQDITENGHRERVGKKKNGGFLEIDGFPCVFQANWIKNNENHWKTLRKLLFSVISCNIG